MDKEKTGQTEEEKNTEKTASSATKKDGVASSQSKSDDNKTEKSEIGNLDKEKSDVEAEIKKESSEAKQATTKPTSTFRAKKKNRRRQVRRGRVYIKSSYNNTIVLFTDMHGNSLAWSSAGSLGFKGAKKATTYAANQVALDADEKVRKYGVKDVEVFVKGVGSGRDAALRALAQKGYNIISIKDTTPVPHNGCRPRKPRRV